MEALFEVGVFSLKALVIVVSILVVALVLTAIAAKAKLISSTIEIKDLNEKFKNFEAVLASTVLSKKQLKKHQKQLKKQQKADKDIELKKAFVVDFDGDMKASAVKNLRDEITAVLSIAEPGDEVIVTLESPGGMVHAYGLAAAQLLRIKKAGIPLTVCVDKVAASGGYMMACIADRIVSAPFAIVGSIGVLAQVPNLHRFLKNKDIDYEEITAGEYKRTISLLGEISEKGREKFTEDIQLTHGLFKDWVQQHRPKLTINEVATGEHWYGQKALEKNLVDEIQTSDEYLLNASKDKKIFQVKIRGKRSIQQKLAEGTGRFVGRHLPDWLMELQSKRFY